MKIRANEIEKLLPEYFSGDLSEEKRTMIEDWRKESPDNETLYYESLKTWEAISLLKDMEQFNSFDALKKINRRINLLNSSKMWSKIQRIASILLLPFLIYSGYLTIRNLSLKRSQKENVVMQTVTSRQGMVSQFTLIDGTNVWLNSGSELQFPVCFSGDIREVKLRGEAYFEVAKNEKKPFRVNAKGLSIDALGTSFNVVSYDDEPQLEVTLVEGKIRLSGEKEKVKQEYGMIYSGQRVVFKSGSQKVCTESVDVDKYIAWRYGNLIFRDDSMENVVKRISRWFNVEIVINDPEIKNYIYKATFSNETLSQVLHLLELSAPIDYRIIESTALPNGEFTKQKINLMKRQIKNRG